jgi:uncharacterized damage-inducible protein DinB
MKALFTDLFRYTHHMNQELFRSVPGEKAPDEKIISLLSHIVNAHAIWNSRLAGLQAMTAVWNLRNPGELAGADKENYEDTLGLVDRLGADSLIAYTNTKGLQFTNSVRDILFHIVNHSTHHRAQVACLLRKDGASPPVSDYIAYRR